MPTTIETVAHSGSYFLLYNCHTACNKKHLCLLQIETIAHSGSYFLLYNCHSACNKKHLCLL